MKQVKTLEPNKSVKPKGNVKKKEKKQKKKRTELLRWTSRLLDLKIECAKVSVNKDDTPSFIRTEYW